MQRSNGSRAVGPPWRGGARSDGKGAGLVWRGSSFCAGGDVKLDKAGQILGLEDPEHIRAADVHRGYRGGVTKVVKALHGLEIPTIVSVSGWAVGLGCDFALACDMRIAAEGARFREAWIDHRAISGGHEEAWSARKARLKPAFSGH